MENRKETAIDVQATEVVKASEKPIEKTSPKIGDSTPKVEKSRENRVMPVTARNKIGRNQPCPCGSGKKYKQCCWGKQKVEL